MIPTSTSTSPSSSPSLVSAAPSGWSGLSVPSSRSRAHAAWNRPPEADLASPRCFVAGAEGLTVTDLAPEHRRPPSPDQLMAEAMTRTQPGPRRLREPAPAATA